MKREVLSASSVWQTFLFGVIVYPANIGFTVMTGLLGTKLAGGYVIKRSSDEWLDEVPTTEKYNIYFK